MPSFYFTLYVSVIFYFLCLFSIQARFTSGKGRHPSEGLRLENGLGLVCSSDKRKIIFFGPRIQMHKKFN